MGVFKGAYIMPHPPIIVPEVGRGKEIEAKDTISALYMCAEDICKKSPETIIIISPHAPVFGDHLYISEERYVNGSLEKFDAKNVEFGFKTNEEFIRNLKDMAQKENISCGKVDKRILRKYDLTEELDHGVLVPLYYILNKYKGFRLVHMAFAQFSTTRLYDFGICIQKAINKSEGSFIVIASGDMSHKVNDKSPYGYNPAGPEFDREVVKHIKSNNFYELISLDQDTVEKAGECGYKSFVIMAGCFEGITAESKVLSYEAPFGIGYMVSKIDNKEPANYSVKKEYEKNRLKKIDKKKENEDEYIKLARTALEEYVLNFKEINIPESLPEKMLKDRAGVFVSIKKEGMLRGCIGTTAPVHDCIAREIIRNAINAGMQDPRFLPVSADELEWLEYSVDVLSKAYPVRDKKILDPKKYGIIVRKGIKSGLLLPDLEGVDTVEQQISIALKKAGISPVDKYEIECFKVIRHK